MSIKHLLVAIVSALLLTACVQQQAVRKSALELQAVQAKEFETTQKIAFASVLSVFQDLGYTINSASAETGVITAKSPTTQDFVPFVGMRMTDVKATAFVEEIVKGRIKVRLSFVKAVQTSGGRGQKGESETPIDDPQPYQDAFTKIQQSIFVRTNAS